MKVKLLKKLRKQFYIHFYTSNKQYILYTPDGKKYSMNESQIKAERNCAILNYARKHYRKYSKYIKIA